MKERRRLQEMLQRISDENIRRLILDSIAIRDRRGVTGNAPNKEYRQVFEQAARDFGDPPAFELAVRSEEELRKAVRHTDGNASRHRELIRLEKIEIHNFRSYYKPTIFELNPLGARNVTVVLGSNGEGKTTLFDAIQWALFGDDFLNDLASLGREKREDLVNFNAVAELKDGKAEVETRVVLWFRTGASSYYVRRSFSSVLLNGNLSSGLVQTSVFQVEASGNHVQMPDGSLPRLLSGLPKNVKDFYLFDGERINQFATANSQKLVRDAIRRIVGVSTMEAVEKDLAALAKTVRREQKRKSSGEAAALLEEDETLRELIEERTQRYRQLQDDILDLEHMIEALDAKLRESPDTSALQRRRDDYQLRLKDLASRQEQTAVELREALPRMSIAAALPAVEALSADLDEEREAGVIPGIVSRQLINDILATGQCICGSPVDSEHDTARHLKEALSRIAAKDEVESMLDLYYKLGNIESLVRDPVAVCHARQQEYWSLLDQQEEIERALAGIEQELLDIGSSNREGWEQERKEKWNQLTSRNAELVAVERQLAEDTGRLKELAAAIRDASKEEQEATYLHAVASWLELIAATLQAVISEFASLARIEVESRTVTLWHALLPNVSQYQVEVSENFEIRVQNPAGAGGLSQLSMGQQQCLGLAFITAVAYVSETKPPLVIDMPFGRLAAEVSAEVARALPGLTSQLLLFLLPDTEWNEPIQAALAPHLARISRLHLDEASSITSVKTS